MYSTGFPILPAIPTSIRNRLYSNRRTEPDRNNLNGDLHGGLASSSSEPHLLYHPKSAEPEASDIRRPKTASDDLDSFDSSSRKSGSPRVEDVGSPANYESASGLRWNRVIPAFNLLRKAGYEAQQPQADTRLARFLYINALVYLLDALPLDLTTEESAMLQERVPQSIKSSLRTCPGSHRARLERSEPSPPSLNSPTKSYLHRLLATTIVQFFILARFLFPYFKLLLRQLYQYERSHRITERIVTTTLGTADRLSKGSVNIGSVVLNFNEGKVGAALSNLAAWWVEGVAGGIYEGVSEGIVQLGFIGRDLELDRITMQIAGRF